MATPQDIADWHADLAGFMLAHPRTALAAVRRLKVAGPRVSQNNKSGSRTSIDGGRVATIYVERARYFANEPRGSQIYRGPTESIDDFVARVDRTWVDAGWVFVDDDGTVHRKE